MNPVLQNILSRLQGVKKDGKGWKALCPAHDDRKPSLKVDEAEDGKVLLKCFAGCGTEDIIAAIGLKMSDLYPEPKQRPVDPGRVVATYDYKDASGKLLYQVCRTAGKRFFQRRPDGKGGWLNGLGGIQPVLYRLPEVLQAVERGETVFIPEGEKDVDNLARLGLAATCNPMGAGKWRDHYSEHLRGAKVVILPDNDEPGRKHAQQVAQSLYGKAVSVRVLELPELAEKGDVSDWLTAGGTKDELLRLAAECPEWRPGPKVIPSIINLADVEPEDVDFFWKPYIPKGKLTILEGDPGLGKTFLALNLCAAATNGWPLPGQDGKPEFVTEPSTVLFMTAEDGLADTIVPRLEKMGADRSKVYCLTGWRETEEGEEKAFTLQDLPALREALEQVKPSLVIIDPLQGYLGPVDMHKANETRPLLSGLSKLAEEYNCAVIAIRHLSKTGGKAIYRGLGSIDFTAAARSILLVGENPSTGEKAMVHTKSSCAEKGVTQGFTITELDGFRWTGVSNCTAEDLLAMPAEKSDKETESPALDEAVEFFLGILGNGEKVPCKEVRKKWKEVGISEMTARRAREKLGVKLFYGKNGMPNCWYLPVEYVAHTKEHEQDEQHIQTTIKSAFKHVAHVAHVKNDEQHALGNDVAHTNTDGQDGQDTKTPIESAFGYVAHVAHAQSDGQDTLEYDDIAEGLF